MNVHTKKHSKLSSINWTILKIQNHFSLKYIHEPARVHSHPEFNYGPFTFPPNGWTGEWMFLWTRQGRSTTTEWDLVSWTLDMWLYYTPNLAIFLSAYCAIVRPIARTMLHLTGPIQGMFAELDPARGLAKIAHQKPLLLLKLLGMCVYVGFA